MRTEKRKQYEKEYNLKHPWATRPITSRLLWNAKQRAKKQNLEFNITEEDIIIPEECPYLKIRLESSQSRGCKRRAVASLDRIDNTQGYIKGNIEVISHLANTMKNNSSIELLLAFSKEVIKRYG